MAEAILEHRSWKIPKSALARLGSNGKGTSLSHEVAEHTSLGWGGGVCFLKYHLDLVPAGPVLCPT